MGIPDQLKDKLTMPVIGAPLFLVSGPDLVIAQSDSFKKHLERKYNLSNKKILVSNGTSFVIKTISSYYIYPLKKTPLNIVLDKKFLLDEIGKSESYYSDKSIIAFKFFKDENEIILFFDKKTLNLKGWQTIDLYQNLNIVYLSSILINQKIEKKNFELPSSDLKN